jgi:hypothetical protein
MWRANAGIICVRLVAVEVGVRVVSFLEERSSITGKVRFGSDAFKIGIRIVNVTAKTEECGTWLLGFAINLEG